MHEQIIEKLLAVDKELRDELSKPAGILEKAIGMTPLGNKTKENRAFVIDARRNVEMAIDALLHCEGAVP